MQQLVCNDTFVPSLRLSYVTKNGANFPQIISMSALDCPSCYELRLGYAGTCIIYTINVLASLANYTSGQCDSFAQKDDD